MDKAANFSTDESVKAFALVMDKALNLETCYLFEQDVFETERRVKFLQYVATDEKLGTIKAQDVKTKKIIYETTYARKKRIANLKN